MWDMRSPCFEELRFDNAGYMRFSEAMMYMMRGVFEWEIEMLKYFRENASEKLENF